MMLFEGAAVKQKRFVKPSVAEVAEYCHERGNGIDPEEFWDFYESKGWRVGQTPMKDWRAAVRTWERRDRHDPPSGRLRAPFGTLGKTAQRWLEDGSLDREHGS